MKTEYRIVPIKKSKKISIGDYESIYIFCQQTRDFKCTILRYQLNLIHTILCYGFIFDIHKKLKISK